MLTSSRTFLSVSDNKTTTTLFDVIFSFFDDQYTSARSVQIYAKKCKMYIWLHNQERQETYRCIIAHISKVSDLESN